MPEISIIIPAYQKDMYVQETIRSVQKSTLKDIEIIIVDDGSKDKTKEKVIDLAKTDNRIQYHYQENQGVCVARNFGISLARSEFILPLDSDDVIHPKYLEEALDVFKHDTEVKLVYCNALTFKGNSAFGKPWFLGDYNYADFLGICSIFPACVFRKDDFLKDIGYDPRMVDGLEDWEFLIRFLKDAKVHQLPNIRFFYRAHADNSRQANFTSLKKKRDRTFNQIYEQNKAIYNAYYGDLSIEVVMDICYQKHRFNKLLFLLKNPFNLLPRPRLRY